MSASIQHPFTITHDSRRIARIRATAAQQNIQPDDNFVMNLRNDSVVVNGKHS
jgi:hypothetical protein